HSSFPARSGANFAALPGESDRRQTAIVRWGKTGLWARTRHIDRPEAIRSAATSTRGRGVDRSAYEVEAGGICVRRNEWYGGRHVLSIGWADLVKPAIA